uniref:Uncharacterized protein n=1 Tax=Plectus sambesii TaxID=2011161 RepID=A0A914VQD5_9BILA
MAKGSGADAYADAGTDNRRPRANRETALGERRIVRTRRSRRDNCPALQRTDAAQNTDRAFAIVRLMAVVRRQPPPTATGTLPRSEMSPCRRRVISNGLGALRFATTDRRR